MGAGGLRSVLRQQVGRIRATLVAEVLLLESPDCLEEVRQTSWGRW